MKGGSKYVGMIFLVNLTKNVRKNRGVVKLCWNKFHSKENNKNVIKSGGGSKYVGMIFLVNLTKKYEKIGELSNYVGMNFLAKQMTKI